MVSDLELASKRIEIWDSIEANGLLLSVYGGRIHTNGIEVPYELLPWLFVSRAPEERITYDLNSEKLTRIINTFYINGDKYEYVNWEGEGIQAFKKNDKLHCVDGPAVVRKNSEEYYTNGKLHRMDGPSIRYLDTSINETEARIYSLNGKRYNLYDFISNHPGAKINRTTKDGRAVLTESVNDYTLTTVGGHKFLTKTASTKQKYNPQHFFLGSFYKAPYGEELIAYKAPNKKSQFLYDELGRLNKSGHFTTVFSTLGANIFGKHDNIEINISHYYAEDKITYEQLYTFSDGQKRIINQFEIRADAAEELAHDYAAKPTVEFVEKQNIKEVFSVGEVSKNIITKDWLKDISAKILLYHLPFPYTHQHSMILNLIGDIS